MHRTVTNFAVLTLALTLACGDGTVDPDEAARVQGSITDGGGQQARLGGSGTVEAAARVQAMPTRGGSAGEVVATADVQADGTFVIDVPPNAQQIVIVAVDG